MTPDPTIARNAACQYLQDTYGSEWKVFIYPAQPHIPRYYDERARSFTLNDSELNRPDAKWQATLRRRMEVKI